MIALRHFAVNPLAGVVTAKEVAEAYGIPYELLSKVLQKLVKAGLIVSHQGVRGGYTLAKHPDDVPVSAIINAIEGTTPRIAQCMADGPQSCMVFDACTIKSPLTRVQANIELAFSQLTLSQIV